MARFLIILCGLVLSFFSNASLYAGSAEHDCATGSGCYREGKECRSNSHWRCGKRKGDWYGARRKVTSPEDAKTQFTAYFDGQSVTISDISEKPWRFEAEVKNKNGDIVDRVIIDKRSGRIRSIY